MPQPCKNYRQQPPSNNVVISPDMVFSCNAYNHEYQFNLKAHRYLAAYLVGYVDGEDVNDDTPSVTAGVCTKIE